MTEPPVEESLAAPAGKSRRRAFVFGGAAAVALAAFAGGALYFRHGQTALEDGSAVLGLVLPDIDGKPQAFAQWRGKVLVVNFWATWCVPCREEMPQFIEAQARDAGNGVQFVGIAVDDADKVREFVKQIALNYPAVIGGFGAIELSRQLGNDLAALPFTIVVDRRGRVAFTKLGPVKRAELDLLLRGLLRTA